MDEPAGAPCVRDLMSTDLITVAPNDDLGQALRKMSSANVRRLPVIQSEQGDPVVVGILTDRDLRIAANSPYLYGSWEVVIEQLGDLTVADVMSERLVTIGPDGSPASAAQRMIEARVGGLPVVEQEHDRLYLVGIITRTDLLAHLVRLETIAG
jgi:acetoin utilization protein AcuB